MRGSGSVNRYFYNSINETGRKNLERSCRELAERLATAHFETHPMERTRYRSATYATSCQWLPLMGTAVLDSKQIPSRVTDQN